MEISGLNSLLPLLGVGIGGLITYWTTHSMENKRAKKEDERKEFERRMEIFQTLEFIEKKCEFLIKDYNGMGDHLDLSIFPTFRLIELEKLSRVRFFLKNNYKKKYKMFLEIEKKLKIRKKIIERSYFENEGSISMDESYSLSNKVYQELEMITEDIRCIKETI